MTSPAAHRDAAATGAAPLRILLAGGGTAGHVNPLLATAAAIRELRPDTEIVVLGTVEGLEARLVPEAGLELVTIDKVPFPRRPNAAAARFPGRLARTVSTVRRLMRARRIDAVVGFGGYVCPPAYLAAASLRIPLIVHEANRRPGMANRLGARRAALVATAFADTPLPRAERIGMPMRAAVARLDRAARREEARRRFGLDPDRPTLLVTGGSLGAARLNAAIAETASEVVDSGAQILHITGRGKTEGLPELPGYVVREYVTAMEDAYAAADLAVLRSGSGTVNEIAAIGLPSVLVPLPIGNGEQALNGEGLVTAGGAIMIDDADFTAVAVRERVAPLLHDAAALRSMSSAAAAFGIPDAAERLAARILETGDTFRGARA